MHREFMMTTVLSVLLVASIGGCKAYAFSDEYTFNSENTAITGFRGISYSGRISSGAISMGVNVYSLVSSEPAPMGIADYGIGSDGPYEYATNSSVGIVTVASLSTRSFEGSRNMSFQLNVNLVFSSSDRQYVYWVQDVAYLDTSTRVVSYLNNVWNASMQGAKMSPSGIRGNGTVYTTRGLSLYYCLADQSLPGNNVPLTYPATILFNVTAGVNISGEPTVSFAYDDGYGLVTYDTVTFPEVGNGVSLSGFEVNGFNYDPVGLFYDSELILGGQGGGSQTTDLRSDVQLQLEYWNGHNYQSVPCAYNFGSNTGEAIDNVLSQLSHISENGTIIAKIEPGSGHVMQLYDLSQLGTIEIKTTLTTGVLKVASSSDSTVSPAQYPFVDGRITLTLYPGYYNLQLCQNGEVYDQTNVTVSAGQTLSVHAPFTSFTHNIVVSSVVLAKTVIGEGFDCNVTVHVANLGQYAETFNLTAYANDTEIGTQEVQSLGSTGQTTLTFVWDTTGLDLGNYTISSYAWPVSDEDRVSDNNCTGGAITISLIGDITGPSGSPDGTIDVRDLGLAARCFGSPSGISPWEPNVDVNNDGKINMKDIGLVARSFR
jgi:hypothetical protein